jgi:crotonobetainyl-CoA:carnitine CoA-transferase CaiB-like acyl-CoA transferase
LELAAAADVIVEGFRPGVMARLGLGEAAVRAFNSGVVYCSISGYGQQGPLAVAPGHDLNYQAWAGALAPDGGAAVMPPLPLADLASGMTAAFGICAALLGRGTRGPGTYLDISMTDVMATWTGSASSVSDEDPVGGGGGSAGDGDGDREVVSGSRGVPGYGLFSTVDGRQVALGVVNEQHFWSALCIELGLADLGGLSFSERLARSEELAGAVTDAIGSRRRDDLVSSLLAAGVPAAPVLDRAGMIANGPFPGFPIRLGGAPGPSPPPAPSLDQHRGQGFRRARSG